MTTDILAEHFPVPNTLRGEFLWGANLWDANLRGADLRGVR